jgi:hypothetical protein
LSILLSGSKRNRIASNWLDMVAKESGVELRELVEIHQRKLIEKSLLTDRTFSGRSGIVLGSHFRLPPLAVAICTFIKAFDENGTAQSKE